MQAVAVLHKHSLKGTPRQCSTGSPQPPERVWVEPLAHLPEGTGVGREGMGVMGSTAGSGASAPAGFWWIASLAWQMSGRESTHSCSHRKATDVAGTV